MGAYMLTKKYALRKHISPVFRIVSVGKYPGSSPTFL